jgi:hypothetical protein
VPVPWAQARPFNADAFAVVPSQVRHRPFQDFVLCPEIHERATTMLQPKSAHNETALCGRRALRVPVLLESTLGALHVTSAIEDLSMSMKHALRALSP